VTAVKKMPRRISDETTPRFEDAFFMCTTTVTDYSYNNTMYIILAKLSRSRCAQIL
jgi:hypothetical protein